MSKQRDIVDAVIRYYYNVNRDEIFNVVYGEGHSAGYRNEKINRMADLARWWAELDNGSRDNLVNMACERFGI